MREALGGVGLMYIVMIFLIVYIFFMAIVINYGRVFRVKNYIISYIEQQEGFKDNDVTTSIIAYAHSKGYYNDIYVCYNEVNSKYYFSVKVYMSFDWPLIGDNVIDPLKITVSGETSAIKKVSSSNGQVVGVNPCSSGYKKLTSS